MSDQEDEYISEEDSDYRPSDDGSDADSDAPEEDDTKTGKKTKATDLKRKRKGGIKLEDEPDEQEETEAVKEEKIKIEEEKQQLEKEREEERKKKKEEEEKKRGDELWKSLMSDVGQRPKVTKKPETVEIKDAKTDKDSLKTKEDGSKEVDKAALEAPTKETVTVTKVFDFAGEKVEVKEEVAADSKEAKSFLQKPLEMKQEVPKPGISGMPSGLKRKPGGIGSVLGQINKKNKISVLDKSKLDWNKFKTKEGISEELKIHNKGKEGYLEKQNFLQETDLRQYEIERKMRMSLSKR